MKHTIRIHGPRDHATLQHPSLFAHGTTTDPKANIWGRLIPETADAVIDGIPLVVPDAFRWVLRFDNVPEKGYFHLVVGASGSELDTVEGLVARSYVKPNSGVIASPTQGAVISDSSFTTWGTFTDWTPSSITATLASGNHPGLRMQVSDPTTQFAFYFSNITPNGSYTETVSGDSGQPPTVSVSIQVPPGP